MKVKYIISFFLMMFGYALYSQKIGIKDTIYITQCDTGSQGKMVLDLDQIKNSVFSSSGKAISPTVYIATAGGGVLKIVDVTSNPTIQNVCKLNGYSWTDIAINKDKQLFLTSPTTISTLDTTNCTVATFYNNPGMYTVALSFDTKNNLYYSDNTAVFRFNNTIGIPQLWKDFGSGTASGDFVMKNDKMYISWENGGVDLYEVTVDNNINYVSHINKCRLKTKTYGLASELGQLYGVTPTELYKIDEVNCKYSTVISNTSGVPWYGAAGFHEAQNSATVHLTNTEAVNITNPQTGKWTNTIPYNQLIYVTIIDKIKDSQFIYPVKITIAQNQKITETKTICKGTSYNGYTTAGTYTNLYKSKAGCDSSHTLILKVDDTIYQTIKHAICTGEQYKSYTNTGIYKENYKTVSGCDSILTIDLLVKTKSFLTINKTICTGKSYLGRSNPGTYLDTFINSQGCDSVRTLILSVISIPKPMIDKYSCIIPGLSFRFYSQIISKPGIFIDSTNHLEDCDTIFKLHVLLQIPKSDSIATTECQGYLYKGKGLYNDTTLLDTIRSRLGCDSIYRRLSIHIQKLLPSLPLTKFYCDTFLFKNVMYDKDTALHQTFIYSASPYCDSLRQKYIYRRAPKPAVTIQSPSGNYLVKGSSMTLIAKGTDEYLWSTSERNASIRISPRQTTTYTVQGWNQYHCLDTAKIDIEVEDLVYFDLPSAFSPNADGENDVWTPNASGHFTIHIMDIFNRWGEKVYAGSRYAYSWNGEYRGQPQSTGVYTYYLLVEKNRQLFERKGSFTLVR
jgi:gliding motility-associated-like protein